MSQKNKPENFAKKLRPKLRQKLRPKLPPPKRKLCPKLRSLKPLAKLTKWLSCLRLKQFVLTVGIFICTPEWTVSGKAQLQATSSNCRLKRVFNQQKAKAIASDFAIVTGNWNPLLKKNRQPLLRGAKKFAITIAENHSISTCWLITCRLLSWLLCTSQKRVAFDFLALFSSACKRKHKTNRRG